MPTPTQVDLPRLIQEMPDGTQFRIWSSRYPIPTTRDFGGYEVSYQPYHGCKLRSCTFESGAITYRGEATYFPRDFRGDWKYQIIRWGMGDADTST